MSSIARTKDRDAASCGTFHHVGFVVASISRTVEEFARALSGTWNGRIIHDPLQKVRVTFLALAGGASLELVEPAEEESPVSPFLHRGGGLHHICLEVENLEAELDRARQHGSLIAKAPLPAVAFNGRRIAWIYTREKLLIEYLER